MEHRLPRSTRPREPPGPRAAALLQDGNRLPAEGDRSRRRRLPDTQTELHRQTNHIWLRRVGRLHAEETRAAARRADRADIGRIDISLPRRARRNRYLELERGHKL